MRTPEITSSAVTRSPAGPSAHRGDIAYHVVGDEGWGIPESHRGAFDLLASHEVLPARLAGELSAAAAMRNPNAHGYASVDHQRLWRELPDALGALDAFAAAVAAWLPPSQNP